VTRVGGEDARSVSAERGRPLRVLHLLTAIGHGGAETWLLNMLRQMDRAECAMDFCLKLPEAGVLQHLAFEQGAKVHNVPLRPTHVGYVRGLERLLRSGQYDVVHSHEAVYSGVGVWVARRLNVPVVCTFHHWRSPPQTPLTRHPLVRPIRAVYGFFSKRYAIDHADAVTALSRKVISHLVPNWQSDPRCRLLSLSATIPPRATEDDRRAVREELGLAECAPLVIHAGRFIEQKNHHGLLDVFALVLREVPTAKLLLLGQGPLKDEVLARIERDGLGESVRFLGLREDVARLMSASDLCLFPSRDEGFGLGPLEANAAGIPVVGTSIPGLDEAVEDGVTAKLFALDDVRGMARATVQFLQDPALRARFGAAGRDRAERQFSHAASAQKLLALYRDVLARRRVAAP
jgi:glycosyltransferase EpsF